MAGDIINGTLGNETLTGGLGNDTINGFGGNDTLQGGEGNDQLNGGDGDDLLLADVGNDALDGGDGVDTLDISDAGIAGAAVDLASNFIFSSATGIDTVVNVENVRGSAGDDLLSGDAGANTFYASGGNDVINGRDGTDTFDASAAGTAITADLTTGTVSGAFTATLSNVENIITGSGNDAVTGSADANALSTGDGSDTITGGGGNDTIDGGAGVDTAVVSDMATITATATGWQVAGADGTDTLENVEIVDVGGAGGVRTLLVGNGGFATIQAAVDAANSGDTILIADGTYAGADIAGKASAIVGAGNAVTITGTLSSSGELTAGQELRFENLTIDATGQSHGISARNSAVEVPGVNAGTITLRGVTIENARDRLLLRPSVEWQQPDQPEHGRQHCDRGLGFRP